MEILLLDIETAPNKVYSWGLWDQNIALNQIEATGYVLCWSAKWHGKAEMHFASVKVDGRKKMLARMHKLLDAADIVVHYNGQKFDIPTLNKEFILCGFAPPAPYKQVDLMRVAKQAFRFESNKLVFVSEALKIGTKVKHAGFQLWVDCMDENRPGHERSWKKMEAYNKGDVRLLEKLYRRLRPWIVRHPNMAAMRDEIACPKCGSDKVQRRGVQVAQSHRYDRYHCQVCAGWFRSSKPILGRKRQEHGVNIV